MKDLIEALTILMKYSGDIYYPTICEHDVLYIVGVDPNEVTLEDTHRLNELSFSVDPDTGNFYSFRFGSA